MTKHANKTYRATPGAAADIHNALRARGVTLSAWARAHGYEPRTARMTVQRWAGRTDRTPHGGISRQIMAALKAELGQPKQGAPE